MPLYLVRWPNLTLSIIRARNRDHLELMLDEVGDPGCAQVQEWRGPVWFDLAVPVTFETNDDRGDRPLGPQDVTNIDVSKLLEEDTRGRLENASDGACTRSEMLDAMMCAMFPHLAATLDDLLGDLEDGVPGVEDRAPEELRAAVIQELVPLTQGRWVVETLTRRVGHLRRLAPRPESEESEPSD